MWDCVITVYMLPAASDSRFVILLDIVACFLLNVLMLYYVSYLLLGGGGFLPVVGRGSRSPF